MDFAPLFKIFLVIVAIFVLYWISSLFWRSEVPSKTINAHPTLTGTDLEEWTNIYKAISINYQRTLFSEESISDMAWERWSTITGKEQWIERPNPEYEEYMEEQGEY